MREQSMRSKIVARRTYNRPLDAEGKVFETWGETINRVIEHQRWLWERAKGEMLTFGELGELEELRELMLDRKVSLSGRTLWLGGTDVAKKREASQFNCAFTKVETIYDMVDVLWLLMQGCGVGFTPVVGQLSGFRSVADISVVRSTRTTKGGNPHNVEFVEDGVWTIRVGDSAEAWSKAVGKLLGGKHNVSKLVLDFSELRPSGERLAGYGWISSGDGQIADAFTKIAGIMNDRTSSLLSRIDILDVVNLLGTILSSRRSAEIALFELDQPEADLFAKAKYEGMELDGKAHRFQSNNSLIYRHNPSVEEFIKALQVMVDNGGSEPGIINAQAALKRAPWFSGVNPCAEILLANKGFCNLCEVNVSGFGDLTDLDNVSELYNAIALISRANYRQTCVNLQDGVLQEAWHKNNEFLRLCGVGLTGLSSVEDDLDSFRLSEMRGVSTTNANSMAYELGTELPKNVTTVKPSGTLSKIMDCTEGAHDPVGEYIINNINFSIHDPLVAPLKAAGYRVKLNPFDETSVLVGLPVSFRGAKMKGSAVEQLERYLMLQKYWTEQNTSMTITYREEEVASIAEFLCENWSDVVGVSFILEDDKTYAYLPQEVVTKEEYDEYVSGLEEVDIDGFNTHEELQDDGCATGACPIR